MRFICLGWKRNTLFKYEKEIKLNAFEMMLNYSYELIPVKLTQTQLMRKVALIKLAKCIK